jgi:uncharacterized protein (DUF433 family)
MPELEGYILKDMGTGKTRSLPTHGQEASTRFALEHSTHLTTQYVTLKQAYLTAVEKVKSLIAIEHDVLHGVPRIAGTRIPIWVVLRDLAEGCSVEEIVSEYPPLTHEQITAAIEFAAIVLEVTPTTTYYRVPLQPGAASQQTVLFRRT